MISFYQRIRILATISFDIYRKFFGNFRYKEEKLEFYLISWSFYAIIVLTEGLAGYPSAGGLCLSTNQAVSPVQYHKRLQRLGLTDNPFVPYADGRYFFPLADQAISYNSALTLVVEKPLKNINIVVADPLMGKTQLARRLYDRVNADDSLRATCVLISVRTITPANLVKTISSALGLPHISNNAERMNALHDHLVHQMREYGRSLFLIVDSEINLDSMNVLLEIGNWHLEIPRSRGKPINKSLVQFLLVGRRTSPFQTERMFPQLDTLTIQTNNSRTWGTPSILELANLLQKQVKAAGRETPLFTEGAIDMLIDTSGQIPGKLMQLADLALRNLTASSDPVISEKHLKGIVALDSSPDDQRGDYEPDMAEELVEEY